MSSRPSPPRSTRCRTAAGAGGQAGERRPRRAERADRALAEALRGALDGARGPLRRLAHRRAVGAVDAHRAQAREGRVAQLLALGALGLEEARVVVVLRA